MADMLAKLHTMAENINEEMVKEGFAWHYRQYSHNPEMALAEYEARRNMFGLWQLPATAPWEYRKQPKSSSKSKKEIDSIIMCSKSPY